MWDRGIHGENQIVGVGDSVGRQELPICRSRVRSGYPERRELNTPSGFSTSYSQIVGDNEDHGTHVLDLLLENPQVASLAYDGMAPEASSPFSTLGAPMSVGLVPNYATPFFPTHAGAKITNSWGSNKATYTATSRSVDRHVRQPGFSCPCCCRNPGNQGPGSVGALPRPSQLPVGAQCPESFAKTHQQPTMEVARTENMALSQALGLARRL